MHDLFFYGITCLLLISRFLQFFHSDARYLCEIATHLCLCPFKTTIELTCLQLKRIELNGEAQEDVRGGSVYLGALYCRTTHGFLKSQLLHCHSSTTTFLGRPEGQIAFGRQLNRCKGISFRSALTFTVKPIGHTDFVLHWIKSGLNKSKLPFCSYFSTF